MENGIQEIESNAALVSKQRGFTYDRASVKALEEYIEKEREGMTEDLVPGLVNTLGSFLGECIIKNYGGKWEKDGSGVWRVRFTEESGVFPFSKVRKQIEQGMSESVFSFYVTIPIVFSSSL